MNLLRSYAIPTHRSCTPFFILGILRLATEQSLDGTTVGAGTQCHWHSKRFLRVRSRLPLRLQLAEYSDVERARAGMVLKLRSGLEISVIDWACRYVGAYDFSSGPGKDRGRAESADQGQAQPKADQT